MCALLCLILLTNADILSDMVRSADSVFNCFQFHHINFSESNTTHRHTSSHKNPVLFRDVF